MDEHCECIRLIEDGIPDGWVVACCDEHDPLARVWDTAEDAMAELGGEGWWEEEPGVWRRIT